MFDFYNHKCAYCGDILKPKWMEVDHILASKHKKSDDDEFNSYLNELDKKGFILDSVENYLLACPNCNSSKNNNNFSASNLRFFHDKAFKNAPEIVKQIEINKDKNVSFEKYEPIFEYWEEISFEIQRNLSHAILGYKLNEQDVLSCPKLPQVDEAINRLKIANYAFIDGDPGCGKSISAFQIAYHFKNENFIVYLLKKEKVIEPIFIPNNGEKNIFLIVDDAQTVSSDVIDRLKKKANEKAKIIFCSTHDSRKKDGESIYIPKKECVKTIYKDYLNRSDELEPLLEELDNDIGDSIGQETIKRRLSRASKSESPELFNYVLRGGWQNISKKLESFDGKYKNRALFLTLVSIFQILFTDESINLNWLNSIAKEVSFDYRWDSSDIDWGVTGQFFISKDNLRIIHIETAKRIFLHFLNNATISQIKEIETIIQKAYERTNIPVLGFLWLQSCSSSSSKDIFPVNMTTIDYLFENAVKTNDQLNRGFVVQLMERISLYNYHNDKLYYFNKYRSLLILWFSSVNEENAYYYSSLINKLINLDKTFKLHNEFVRQIDFDCVFRSFDSCPIKEMYKWSDFFERLFSFLLDSEYKNELYSKVLFIVLSKEKEIKPSNIIELIDFIVILSDYNNEKAYKKLIINNKSIVNTRINIEPDAMYHLFGSRTSAYLYGLQMFCSNKITKDNLKFAKNIVHCLSKEHLVREFENSDPHKWQSLYEIMCIVYQADYLFGKSVIESINLERNKKLISSINKCHEYYHLLLHSILWFDEAVVTNYIKKKFNKIKYFDLTTIFLVPELVVNEYGNYQRICLFRNCWHHDSLLSLKAMTNYNRNATEKILVSEIKQFVNLYKNACYLDFYEKPDLLSVTEFLIDQYSTLITEIMFQLEVQDLELVKKECLRNRTFLKPCSIARINKMILLLSSFAEETKKKDLLILSRKKVIK